VVAVVAQSGVTTTTSTAPRPAPLRDRTADARGVARTDPLRRSLPPPPYDPADRDRDAHGMAPAGGGGRWEIERAQLSIASAASGRHRSSRFRCDSTWLRVENIVVRILHIE
jgi:hypothetical protein